MHFYPWNIIIIIKHVIFSEIIIRMDFNSTIQSMHFKSFFSARNYRMSACYYFSCNFFNFIIS